MNTQYNFNMMGDDDVSCLYKGIKCESLKDVDVKTIYHNNCRYSLIKYNKKNINNENVLRDGLFRSVIARDGKIMSYSPPKSLDPSYFKSLYNPEDCYIEEFIEGTMINVFFENYDQQTDKKGKWIISTKSNIGAKNAFFTDGHINPEDTFEQMFLDACKKNNLDLDNLDKNYQYSFVLQHPRNRIVLFIENPKLYVVCVNRIVDNVITRMHPSMYFSNTIVSFPKWHSDIDDNWDKFDEKKFFENDDDTIKMGIVIVDGKTGNRTKLRNPKYEYIKKLRGNQPKSEFRCIELWQQDLVAEYLKYFPEYTEMYKKYHTKLFDMNCQIYNNYVSCFIYKLKPLKEFPFEEKTHMYTLHQFYKKELRPMKKSMSCQVVIDYFKSLPTPHIMHTLNYKLRPIKCVSLQTQ